MQALLALDLDPALPAMRAHGVPELSAYLRGTLSLEEAGRRTELVTGQYTKRQATWFRHHDLADPSQRRKQFIAIRRSHAIIGKTDSAEILRIYSQRRIGIDAPVAKHRGLSVRNPPSRHHPSRSTAKCRPPTVSQEPRVLLRALKDQGVEVIFGYPGGAVLPIYDAIFNQNAIRHILVRQEGGAVHAAEGYARSTGKVGVVLVTSGPGATNAVTGLADALMDSIPVVCLTGQVPTHLIGNDAFQEADTTGITRPATKHNYLVKRSEDLARVVHEAFYVARSGRPGPVVIDLPKDILIGPAPYTEALRRRTPAIARAPSPTWRRSAARDRVAETGEAADHLCRRRRDQFRPARLGERCAN